jgi:hypothetical protein
MLERDKMYVQIIPVWLRLFSNPNQNRQLPVVSEHHHEILRQFPGFHFRSNIKTLLARSPFLNSGKVSGADCFPSQIWLCKNNFPLFEQSMDYWAFYMFSPHQ